MKDLMIILLCFVTLFLGTYRNAQGGITGGSGALVMDIDASGRRCVDPEHGGIKERIPGYATYRTCCASFGWKFVGTIDGDTICIED